MDSWPLDHNLCGGDLVSKVKVSRLCIKSTRRENGEWIVDWVPLLYASDSCV